MKRDVFVAACLGLAGVALSLPAPIVAQMATADRLQAEGWWPTKGQAAREEYAGPESCARCHRRQARAQQTTAMARTATLAADSPVLDPHDNLSFRSGRYSFQISRKDQDRVYSVTDGAASIQAMLGWAFGEGKVGQTYIYRRENALFEGRVSYYDSIAALDFTPARALASPGSLDVALGRRLGDAEARRCFGCHNTASTTSGRLDTDNLILGVTCEACHGPGARHAAGQEQGRVGEAGSTIFGARGLSPADSVDFCGACHGTFWDVTLAAEGGVAALRSQPFRLQSSRCWGNGDARLTCLACHDPHAPLVREARSYDPRCLSCHLQKGESATERRAAAACKVAAEDCASCHMPEYEVPGMHSKFTDHLIRVVRAGAEPAAKGRP